MKPKWYIMFIIFGAIMFIRGMYIVGLDETLLLNSPPPKLQAYIGLVLGMVLMVTAAAKLELILEKMEGG